MFLVASIFILILLKPVKIKLKLPSAKLGKVLLTLIVLTTVTWLFNQDANNCLARDFVEQAPPAVCWRQTNDYESTISYSWTILQVLWVLTIIFSTAVVSKYLIKRSSATPRDNKKTALFLASLSMILLIFICTVIKVWLSTEFNNNNYALNNAAALVSNLGIPMWLMATTAAITYIFSSRHKNQH
jgi:hypothetical protein